MKKIKIEILKKFDKKVEDKSFWDEPDAVPSGYSDGTDYDPDKIKQFISQALDTMRDETREEVIKIIRNEQNPFKIDTDSSYAWDDCKMVIIQLLNQLLKTNK